MDYVKSEVNDINVSSVTQYTHMYKMNVCYRVSEKKTDEFLHDRKI